MYVKEEWKIFVEESLFAFSLWFWGLFPDAPRVYVCVSLWSILLSINVLIPIQGSTQSIIYAQLSLS